MPLTNTAPETVTAGMRQDELTRWENARLLIESTEDLPTAPPIAFKLLSLMRRTDYDNNDLVEVIRYDSELTAQLLKICNSAAYRPAEPIMSISQALLRLGQIVVYEQVLAISLGRMNKGKPSRGYYGLCPFDLWRKSVAAAILARYLGPRCNGLNADRETCFTIGLLHNIGQAVLNIAPLSEIAQIPRLVQEMQLPLLEAERQVLATDHAAIGGALLESWKLPNEVVNSIRYYCQPELNPDGMAPLAFLADFCSHADSNQGGSTHAEKAAWVTEKLGLKTDDIQAALDQLKKEAAVIEAFVMVAM
jgi:HD-like signal output (HDOD) protein